MAAAAAAMNDSGLWLPGVATTKEDKIEKWWEVNRKHDPPLTRGATPLVERCMRVYGWNEAFSRRTLKGYRQFMELKSVMNDWQETKLSAPVAIQQMWEQHILDNLNYTDDCFLLFGRVVGHDPDAILNDRLTHDRIKTTKIAFQARYGGDLDPDVWEYGHHPQQQQGQQHHHVQQPQQTASSSVSQGHVPHEHYHHHHGGGGGGPGGGGVGMGDAMAIDSDDNVLPAHNTPRGRLPVASIDHQDVGIPHASSRGGTSGGGGNMGGMVDSRGGGGGAHVVGGGGGPTHVVGGGGSGVVGGGGGGGGGNSLSPRGQQQRSLVVSSDEEISPIQAERGRSGSASAQQVQRDTSPPHQRPPSKGAVPRSPKSPTGNDPITIFLRDQTTGEETYFSLRYRSTLRIVFTVFAERKGLSQENLKFSFNGQALTGYETPYSLGLEDRARIDVQIGQRRS